MNINHIHTQLMIKKLNSEYQMSSKQSSNNQKQLYNSIKIGNGMDYKILMQVTNMQ